MPSDPPLLQPAPSMTAPGAGQPENGDTFPTVRHASPAGLALLAGLGAGLAAFLVGEVFYDWFLPELVPQTIMSGVVMQATTQTQAAAAARNAAVAFGLLGGSLGLLLGMAGGLARGSRQGTLRGGGLGLALGVLIGLLLPLALVVPYFSLQETRASDDLVFPLAMHSVLWGALGAVGGLAFGIGLGRGGLWRFALLGLMGAILGAAVYEILGTLIDPLADTSNPISTTWRTRLIARMTVALGTAAAVGLVGGKHDASTSQPDPDRHP